MNAAPEPAGTRDAFRLAIAAALFFGSLEAIETVICLPFMHIQPMTKASMDVIWAAPLMHLAVDLVAAAALAILWRLGVRRRWRDAAALFAFTGMLGVLGYTSYLSNLGCLLLALGVGVQAGRLYGKHQRPRRLGRWAVVMGALIVIGTGIVRWQQRWPGGESAKAGEASSSRPNVLVLVADTLRADHVSTYGYGRASTPALDTLASEGVLFEHAYSTSSWTLPSHASFLTGLPVYQHGAESFASIVRDEPLRMAEALRADGYATAAFVANNIFVLPIRGLSDGFDVFEAHHARELLARTSFGRASRTALRPLNITLDPYRTASELNGRFMTWANSVGDRPFFAFINYMEVHQPYRAGARTPDLRVVWNPPSTRTADDVRKLAEAYSTAATGLDAELGRFFEALKQEPWGRNTLIVVLSDHGEEMSDGSFDHGTDLRLEQIHVPLILWMPGLVPSGVRVPSVVSLADVPATIQELIGAHGPKLPGQPLTSWLSANGDAARGQGLALSELVEQNSSDRMQSLVMDGYHYIVNHTRKQERLFDIVHDRDELKDLVNDPASRDVLRRLGTKLRDLAPPNEPR